MENIIKKSVLEKLKNIQFKIDSQLLYPYELNSYLKGRGYSDTQIKQLLDLVYWQDDILDPNCSINKLLANGWIVDDESVTIESVSENVSTVDVYKGKVKTNCLCCHEEVLVDFDTAAKTQTYLCDNCRAAILDMRVLMDKIKEIIK